VGLTTLPCPRNSAGFSGGGQGLRWAVEPRKEKEENYIRKWASNLYYYYYYYYYLYRSC
jgi:hypothetical protein